jgi:uncharacterized membrane protein YphA (DoxX/SURF4 family)
MRHFSSVFLRLALGLSFLSAVADRFGWWGAFGHPNVAWGSFARFVAYTARLNWFLPQAMIPPLAVLSTCVELLLGLFLVVGWQTRIAAACSGIVLIAFGLAMTAALGLEAPLSFSVFSAAGGSLLLATCSSFPYSVDELLGRVATLSEGGRRPA